MHGKPLEWDDIKVFLAIARTGTLAAAAKVIGQAQPTMGRRLLALEAAIGQALFQRTNAGFVLTHEGEAVMAHAERMEEEAHGFSRVLAGKESSLCGILRVSSSDWFGEHILAPIFASFLAKHSCVTLELITDSRQYSLTRREADLAFRIVPFDEPDIIQRKLMTIDYAVYGHQDLPALRPGDGAGHSIITMNTDFNELPDVVWMRNMCPHAHIAFASNNRALQARMCAAGRGFAVLPCLLGDTFTNLRRIDMGEVPPSRDVWMGLHRDMRRVTRLLALQEHTIEELGKRYRMG